MLVDRTRNTQILADLSVANEIDFPELWQDQQNLVLAIDVVNSDGSPATDLFNLSDTFSLAIAQDFNHGTPVLTETLDAGFNLVADRADVDVVNGKLSVQLDGFKEDMVTFLRKKREGTD